MMVGFTPPAQAQKSLGRLPPSVARIVGVAPEIGAGNDSVLRSPTRVTYELRAPLSRGFLEIANAAEPQRLALPDLTLGTHTVMLPAGILLADALGPTIECRLLPPVEGSGITIMTATLFAPRYEGVAVYDFHPGGVVRDYGDPPSDDAAAFRDDARAISGYGIPGPRNIALRARLQDPLLQVRGVGFRDGDSVMCTRGLRRPVHATTRMQRVKVISTASHQSNKRMPVLLGGTIAIPRGLAEAPNALMLTGIPRR
jgi:hypothetical protein